MKGIEIKNLTKHYGSTCALDNVSLTFKENKIYGLLGRNGAGKTTLLNTVTNRIFADSGEVLVDGDIAKENDSALGKLYLMSEKTYYPERMKIKDVYKWTKKFYPDFDEAYAREIAKQFELNVNKSIKSLSTGYKSIFKLTVALAVNTPYVFFDEPVLGLDANNRDLFYKMLLKKYSENPCTIVFSTHLIEEVSGVIEEIIIIKHGTVIRNESCEELLSKGYTVTGAISAVDSYIAGKNVIGEDVIGGLKTAYILGTAPKDEASNLAITGLDLQKLFIKLTN
jgi:ABC-2 type transport system ATP-binding protein